MKLDVLNINGSKNSTITLDDSVFGIEPNHHVVHQAVTSELSNSRQGTHSSKTDQWLEVVEKNLGSKKVAV